MTTIKPRKTIVKPTQSVGHARKISARQKASREWETMICAKDRGPDGCEYWENYIYEVSVRRHDDGWPFDGGPWMQLGISSHDGEARHDWRDFQRIKNDICGEDWEAIELYPWERRVIDPSNYYMLWCARSIPIGMFKPRTIIDETQCIAPQRPWNANDKPEMTEAGWEIVGQSEQLLKRIMDGRLQ